MKLKNVKYLDDKIRKYESIDTLFKNDDCSDLISMNTTGVQEKKNNETMENNLCNKNLKK
jgi:hypothetical protein